MEVRQICVQISVLLLLAVEYSGARVRPMASDPGLEHVDGTKPHSPCLQNGLQNH